MSELTMVTVLFVLNLLAALLRFVLPCAWIFHPRRRAGAEAEPVVQENS